MRRPRIDPRRERLTRLFDRYPPEVLARFKKFHLENDRVWEWFVDKTFELISRGVKRYGARRLFEELRYDVKIKTKGKEVFEVNDDYVPIYARLFVWFWPQYLGFFEFRKVTSKGIMSEEERRRRGEGPEEYLH